MTATEPGCPGMDNVAGPIKIGDCCQPSPSKVFFLMGGQECLNRPEPEFPWSCRGFQGVEHHERLLFW